MLLSTMLDGLRSKKPHNDQKRRKQKKKSHKQRGKTESIVNVFI